MIEVQGEDHMSFTDEQYNAIGTFVKQNLPQWFNDLGYPTSHQWNIQNQQLHERGIRVEEELKHQRELIQHNMSLMEKRFEQIDKRFEQVDKRFEQVDKRFEQVDKRFDELRSDMNARFEQNDKRFNQMFIFMGTGFTLLTILMSLFKFLGP